MGLTSSLNTALFGLTYNQKQLDVTAANVANAGTVGYSSKTVAANVFFDNGGNVSGILAADVRRVVDEGIQSAYFESLSGTEYAKRKSDYTARLDDLFGTLADSSGLNTLVTDFANALSGLVNDPDGSAAQQDVLAKADALARQLNRSYTAVDDLRREVDSAMAVEAQNVNNLLANIQEIDSKILVAKTAGASTADMEDQRDRLVEQLSGYIDVEVSDGPEGTLRITTHDGHQLYNNNTTSKVSFTQSNKLLPGQAGNAITVQTPGGTTFDLVKASDSGSLVALSELRDDILVDAQTQLDTIAAELSLALSNVTVESQAAAAGGETGFDLDVSRLQSGNTVSLQYVDSAGATQNVTFVAVEDPALLPLANTDTARSDDTVYGIDISSGTPATYVTQMIAALAATDLNVSDDGSGNLRVLGDVATTTVVNSLTADVTVTASSDQGLGLAVFVDTSNGTKRFTDALEDGGQRVGYAASIAVNPDLVSDTSKLVIYQTTPSQNSDNDPERPQYLLDALNNRNRVFDPDAEIGTTGSPYQGSVLEYVNEIVAYQGKQAADAKTDSDSRTTLTTNLAIRYEESYSVDVDAELAFMIELQNAYSANARVMQTVRDLFDVLLNTV